MVDDELRALLHKRLDQLLDRRNQIEVHLPRNALGALAGLATAPRVKSPEEASTQFANVIDFAAIVMGEPIKESGLVRAYRTDDDQRKLLQHWIMELLPLLQSNALADVTVPPSKALSALDVLDALSALDAGETKPLFVAKTGKNRRANRWSLARRKLDALVWKKRLRALGYAEKSANFELTKAFGEQWDTMRRWGTQCEAILGRPRVSATLDWAAGPTDIYAQPAPHGMFGSGRPDPMLALAQSGEAYRAELRRSADLMKRRPRTVS